MVKKEYLDIEVLNPVTRSVFNTLLIEESNESYIRSVGLGWLLEEKENNDKDKKKPTVKRSTNPKRKNNTK